MERARRPSRSVCGIFVPAGKLRAPYPTRQIDAIIAPLSLLVVRPPFGVWMRLPFCILNVLGDMLDDGELHFVEAAQSLDAARARVQALSEVWPGEYVIYDAATGDRVSVTAGDEEAGPSSTTWQCDGTMQ